MRKHNKNNTSYLLSCSKIHIMINFDSDNNAINLKFLHEKRAYFFLYKKINVINPKQKECEQETSTMLYGKKGQKG